MTKRTITNLKNYMSIFNQLRDELSSFILLKEMNLRINQTELDGAAIFKVKSGKFNLSLKDIIACLFERDEIKQQIFVSKHVNSISIKKGTAIYHGERNQPNQRWVICFQVLNAKEILVFHAYAWTGNPFKKYLVREKENKVQSTADLDFEIGGNSIRTSCNGGTWKIIDHETAIFTTYLADKNGYNKDTVQEWLDISTDKKVKLLSLKCSEDNKAGFWDDKNTHRYELKVKVLGVEDKEISISELLNLKVTLQSLHTKLVFGKVHNNILYLIGKVDENHEEKSIFFKIEKNRLVKLVGKRTSDYHEFQKYIGYKLIDK